MLETRLRSTALFGRWLAAAAMLFSVAGFAQIGADTSYGDNGYDANGGQLDSVFENAYTVSDPFPFGDGGVLIPFVDRSADDQFNPGPSLKLVRLTEEGFLSPTFGTDGVLEIAPAGGSNYMQFRDAIPVPENYGTGWYVLFSLNFTEGSAPTNYSNGGIVKIGSDGSIVTQWADNGFLYWEGGNDFQQWSKLHINPDSNKLYVFGQQNISEIVRFTGTGQVDTTFFENGIFKFSAYDDFNDARIVAAKVNADDSEGYFIFSGVSDYGCSWPCDARVSVLKMDLDSTTYQSNPGGSVPPDRTTYLDTTFGTDGEIVLNPNEPADGSPDSWDNTVRAIPFDDGSNALVFGATSHYSDTVETARIYRFDADFLQDPNYGFGDANGRADLDFAAEKLFSTSSNELYVFTNRYNGHYGTIIKLTNSGALDFSFDGDGYQDFSACQDNSSEVGVPIQTWSPSDGVFYMLVEKQTSEYDNDGNTVSTETSYGTVKLIDGGDTEVCGPEQNIGGGGGGGGFDAIPGLSATATSNSDGSVTFSLAGIDSTMTGGSISWDNFNPPNDYQGCVQYDDSYINAVGATADCREPASPSEGGGAFLCSPNSMVPPEFCTHDFTPGDDNFTVTGAGLVYRVYDGTLGTGTYPDGETYTKANYSLVGEPFVAGEEVNIYANMDGPTGYQSFRGSFTPTVTGTSFTPGSDTSGDSGGDTGGDSGGGTTPPAYIAPEDYDDVVANPGAGVVYINGTEVAATVESPPVQLADGEAPTADQVALLQNYADDLVAAIEDTLGGGTSPIQVQDTAEGAVITGLISGESVPVQNVVMVKTPQLVLLLTGKNTDGNLATVTDGGVIEFGTGATVSVFASAVTAQADGQVVLFSDPIVLEDFTADNEGIARVEAEIPSDVPVGDHTIVVSLADASASIGFRVFASAGPAMPVPTLPGLLLGLLALTVSGLGWRRLTSVR